MDWEFTSILNWVKREPRFKFQTSMIAKYRARITQVSLVLKDGRTVSSETTEAQGDPENKVSGKVIWDKFENLTTPVLGLACSQSFLTTPTGPTRAKLRG